MTLTSKCDQHILGMSIIMEVWMFLKVRNLEKQEFCFFVGVVASLSQG